MKKPKQDRSHWMAEKTEKFSYDSEFKKFWASCVGFAGGIAGGLIQLIDIHHTHWMNLIAALGCGMSAGYWMNECITHFSNWRIIKSMGEVAQEVIDRHTSEADPIDEKELNELKKITGME